MTRVDNKLMIAIDEIGASELRRQILEALRCTQDASDFSMHTAARHYPEIIDFLYILKYFQE